MQYTKEEICKIYRDAKDKNAQIKILAELNDSSADRILQILTEAGMISGLERYKKIQKGKERKGPIKKQPVYWTEEMKEELLRRTAEGMDCLQIAERMGLDKRVVQNKLYRLKNEEGAGQKIKKIADGNQRSEAEVVMKNITVLIDMFRGFETEAVLEGQIALITALVIEKSAHEEATS